ncbi:o-succinylbenzoate synthase [Rummeliibacillus pycnus]|uniref:o-succinylbenzoate synthase n=1 Tax=Rummeliibacillus pycnus TaxID=101070 RepID=UPI003D2C9640
MKIDHVTIRQLKMRMKSPFVTSFGSVQDKQFLIVEVKDENGLTGYGEGVAFEVPWYTEETMKTSWHILEDFLVPMVLHKEIGHPSEISQLFRSIRRNNMAKAAIETAIWDLYAKQNNLSLAKALGGSRNAIEVGISIGIQPTISDLYEKIDFALKEGYKRIKVKIKPGLDISLIRAIRNRYPDIPLMADANSSYTLEDYPLLKELDQYNLLMIEQPLAADDILEHAKLQQQIQTPICLDESICSYDDAKTAIELGSCGVINIKYARVGGLTEAKRIHDLCKENNIKVWCGGMLEAGVGRAHAIALTTLSNFALPGDTAGSKHYWDEDIIEPEVEVNDGYIQIPNEPGIGYRINYPVLERYTVKQNEYK